MKICGICGFECEDEAVICPTCGKNCDGSEPKKKESSSSLSDPFERYRKEIDNQIKEQEKRISDLQQQISTDNEEKQGKKKKKKDFDEFDRTELFSEEDVNENRLYALLLYLTGIIGIIIALLKDKASPYLNFHINQVLKAVICETAVLIFSVLLCFTFIVPVFGVLIIFALNIIKLISALWVLKGYSKEILILRNIRDLK